MSNTFKIIYSTLAVVMVVNSFVFALPIVANAQAISTTKDETSILNLSAKNKANLGVKAQEIISNSNEVTATGAVQKASKNDKYIKSISQKRFNEIKTNLRKIDNIQKMNEYIGSLKQDEALAALAGLLLPYQKTETTTQTISSKIASNSNLKVVAAANLNMCSSTNHYGAFKTYDGFTISNWSFRMNSCYNRITRELNSPRFETEPYTYNRAWWIGNINIYSKGCRQDGTWKVICQFQTESSFAVGINVAILGISYNAVFYNYAGAYRTTSNPYAVYTSSGSGAIRF